MTESDDLKFEDVTTKAAMTPEESRLLAAFDKHPTPRPEVERDNLGRYVLRHPESGKKGSWTRTTTMVGAIDETYNIQQWSMGLVALGVATHDLHRKRILKLADPKGDDKAKLRELANEAKDLAGGSVASSIGTALHAFTEHHDLGTGVVAPAPYDKDIAAYVESLAEAGIVAPPEWVERIIVNTDVKAAGTFDRIVRLPDGRLVILDVKTGQSVDRGWPKIAAQLAVYANASHWLDDDNAWQPMPKELDRTTGLVAHVPAGSGICNLYEVDLVKGLKIVNLCVEIREARSKNKRKGYLASIYKPGEAIETTGSETSSEPEPEAKAKTSTKRRSNQHPEPIPDDETPEQTQLRLGRSISDQDVVNAIKAMKKDPDQDDAVEAFRARVVELDLPRKPPWSDAERGAIHELLWPGFTDADTDHEMVAARAAEQAATSGRDDSEPFVLPDPPESDEPGDYAGVKALLAELKATDAAKARMMGTWVREAKAAGRPLSTGKQEGFTTRHEMIVSAAALLLLAIEPVRPTTGKKGPPASVHQLVTFAIDEVCGTSFRGHAKTGPALGSLDLDQATKLFDAASQQDGADLTERLLAADAEA